MNRLLPLILLFVFFGAQGENLTTPSNPKQKPSHQGSTNASESSIGPDRDALVAIYNALDGSNWDNTWDLSEDDYSTWQGVSVNGDNRVVQLFLGNNNLTGIIPSEIGSLESLEILNLGSNSITGVIPDELFTLPNLTNLDISFNQLSGSISDSIEGLTSLQGLYLNNNDLSGPLPSTLGSLNNLQTIFLSDNDLTGVIPESIGTLPISYLDLARNDFEGALPSGFSNMPSLVELDLDSTLISGNLPDLSNSVSLEYFNIQSTNFTGAFPSYLLNLSSLQFLQANNVSFDPYELDNDVLSNAVNLEVLVLFNSNLQGTIPQSISNLGNLRSVNLSQNSLNGDVPVINSTALNVYSVAQNNFIPENLEEVKLHYNSNPGNFVYGNQANVDETENITIEEGVPVVLEVSATVSPNNTYQWFKNDASLTGETNRTLELAGAIEDSGTYHCVIGNTILDPYTQERNPINLSVTLSNDDFKRYDMVSIAHNDREKTLSVDSKIDNGSLRLTIIDITGRTIDRHHLSLGHTAISTSNLFSGIYFAHFETPKGKMTKKFLVK